MKNNIILPAWCDELRKRLDAMAAELTETLGGWQEREGTVTPEDMGYTGGKATEYIQAAIDRTAEKGGTVLLRGEYVTGSLVLKSNVRLKVDGKLIASTDLADFPEHKAKRFTVQDAHMGMNQALIFAEGCENICICGGEIDGRGTQDNFPGDETVHGTPGRPFLIRMVDCTGVHIHDITLRDAACWMQNYFNCEQLLMESITVRNQANYNNDGIDIDGCRGVIVRNCDVMSGDDALCFKGASEKNTERVLVENCRLYSSCNAIKVGTDTQGSFRDVLIRHCHIGGVAEDVRGIKHPCSDSGISLEMLDGGILENFRITDVDITRAWSPIFMRMEDRGRVKPDDPKPGIGILRRVLIENVSGRDNGPRGSYMLGAPERSIEDVVISNVEISQLVSEKPITTDADFDEMRGIYPDAHMIDDKGDAPAYALWARHVKGLYLKDYRVIPAGTEKRSEFALDNDVEVTIM
ncbi:MAG: right-handed parallel beta-helix repeat-containing protein [Oscillospiraceae bacterium]|nr:right-handed parallel beta-helix repeat-containing protein [Oscillospiraceae bacterium]